MKKFLPWVISLAAIALIAFAFFWPDAVNGNTLQQHDMQQGLANGQETAAWAAATGHTSYWTNSLFGGMPTFQISPSYPSTRLFLWFNTVYGLLLPGPSNLLAIMMIGFFILMMAMKVRWPLALTGAVAWGLSSYFVIIIGAGHLWKFITLSYVPPTLAGLVLIYRGRRWLGAGVAAWFMMMQVAANHVQMTYYFSWVMAGFVIAYGIMAWRDKSLKKWGVSTAVLAGALLLGVAANLPNLYNTYEYSKQTIRGRATEIVQPGEAQTSGLSTDYITQYSYGRAETFSLLIPNVEGGASAKPVDGRMQGLTLADTDEGQALMRRDGQMTLLQLFSQYFGGAEGTNGPVYVGAIIVALFLLGAIVVRGPLKWVLVALTVLSIFLAWGRNMQWFTDLFISVMPMYAKFRTVESILVIAELTMPLLGILGLQKVLEADKPWQQYGRAILWSFGIPLAICLIGIMAPGFFGSTVMGERDQSVIQMYLSAKALPEGFDMMQYPAVVTAAEQMREGMVRADALRSFLFVAVAAIALWAFATKRLKAVPTVAVIGLAVLIDLYVADKRYVNSDSFTTPRQEVPFVASAADRAILQDTTLYYRVLDLPNFGGASTSYFHHSVGGYHAAKLTRYNDLITYSLVPNSPEVLAMLNTRWVIDDPSQQPMFNPEALGNAWFVNELHYVDSPREELGFLTDFDPATEAVADRQFAPVLGTPAPADSTDVITLTSYAPDRLTYTAESKRGGLAVFSDIYFPWGWTATVNGEEVPLGRVNYVLRALPLPAGRSEVTMEFHPASVTATNSVATGAVIAVYLLLLTAALLAVKKHCSANAHS